MKYLGQMKVSKPESWLEMALGSGKENVESLKCLEADLKSQYKKYDKIILSETTKPKESILTAHKDLLIEYYERAPSKLNKLLLLRRNDHGLLSCPFCGKPDAPDTLDHFMPKDNWPEYSINPNNLVPQCRGCAPTKSSNYYCNSKGAAKYIHPMYSDLLSKFRFKITVTFLKNSDEVSFKLTLKKPESIDPLLTARVVRHFTELKLNKRIVLYCSRELSKWKKLLKENTFDIETALQQRLYEKSQDEQGRDWKTALYIGILENRSLIDYLHGLSAHDQTSANQDPEEEVEL